MAGSGPRILVVDGDRAERSPIVALLREAGFVVAAAGPADAAIAAIEEIAFAAAVIALPGRAGIELVRRARGRQPDLRALIVVEPAALTLDPPEDGETLIKCPFEPRELLGCLFELVLREKGHPAAPRPPIGSHREAAEFGIAAAQLACLRSRHASAVAAGEARLAQDLARQIDSAPASPGRLAASSAQFPSSAPFRGVARLRVWD